LPGYDLGEKGGEMKETAKRAFVGALVVVAVVAIAIALWKLKLVIALLFLGFIIAAAMRPGIDALARRGIPRSFGIFVHYIGAALVIGLLLWAIVPRAITQVQAALGDLPQEARESTGFKQDVLQRVQRWLEELPSGGRLVDQLADPALEAGRTAVEISLGVLFTLACAAYWIYERERAERLVVSLLPRKRRRVVRETWELIDRKLGAYVRGQLLLIGLVATVLSFIFWAIGLPFWLLIGVFAGFVEIIPVIGPLAAGVLAVGVGLTVSWQLAVAAGVAVLVVRLLEDYIVIPRVLGHAVGLTPLTVLVAVAAVTILFGGFAVLLAIPLAAVVATLLDVTVRGKEPAQEDVPAMLFPAKEAETEG
jgi:predicted PurR-regulated permease PerM